MVREIKSIELSDLLDLYTHLHESGVPEMSERLSSTWEAILRDRNHHIIVFSSYRSFGRNGTRTGVIHNRHK